MVRQFPTDIARKVRNRNPSNGSPVPNLGPSVHGLGSWVYVCSEDPESAAQSPMRIERHTEAHVKSH
eukprot:3752142-Rhodomonas_salina.2